MLAPCAPLPLLLGLHVVEEEAGGCHIDRVVVQLVAHHYQPAPAQPGDLLHMGCFQDVLLLLGQTQLALELIEAADSEDGDLMLKDDGERMRVVVELEGLKRLIGVRFISLDLDLLLQGPHNKVLAACSGTAIRSDQHALIWRKFGIYCSHLGKQSFVFKLTAVVEVGAFGAADGEVAAQRRADDAVDGVVDGEVVRAEGIFGALIEVVEPVEVDHVGLAHHKLVAQLFIEILFCFLGSGGKVGLLEGPGEDVLLLLLDESAYFVDGVALQRVVLVEFEVVELAEGDSCLRSRTISQIQCLIPHSILSPHLDANQPLLLPDLLGIEQFGAEKGKEFLLIIGLEDGDAVDCIGGDVLMNWLRSSSSSSGFLILRSNSLSSCSTFLQASRINSFRSLFSSISLEKSNSLNKLSMLKLYIQRQPTK